MFSLNAYFKGGCLVQQNYRRRNDKANLYISQVRTTAICGRKSVKFDFFVTVSVSDGCVEITHFCDVWTPEE